MNGFVRSVASRFLLPLSGFRFYAGLLVHVISTCSAETRAAEELPHILYCTLDSNFTREHTQVQEQISADKQRLLDCMVSAPQLHFLTARQNLPLLGLYCHALRGSFSGIDIAISACQRMNDALGTTPVVAEVLPPPPVTSTAA